MPARSRLFRILPALLGTGLALGSAACVPPSQVAGLRDDLDAMRAQRDEERAASQRQAEEIRAMRAMLEASTNTSQESRADLELRLRTLEERLGTSTEQNEEFRQRLEALGAEIASLRSMPGSRAQAATPPPLPPPPAQTFPPAASPLGVTSAPQPGGTAAAAPEPGPGQAAAPAPASPVSDALQDLFNAAYSDYSKGRYPLAIKGFEEIIRQYGETDLADNARYWIGVSRMDGGDAAGAVAEFDRLLHDYPDGDRVAPALLKKGLALLQMNRREAGIAELRALVARYPDSDESRVARTRLASLGVKTG